MSKPEDSTDAGGTPQCKKPPGFHRRASFAPKSDARLTAMNTGLRGNPSDRRFDWTQAFFLRRARFFFVAFFFATRFVAFFFVAFFAAFFFLLTAMLCLLLQLPSAISHSGRATLNTNKWVEDAQRRKL
jgi:hypothetical protein